MKISFIPNYKLFYSDYLLTASQNQLWKKGFDEWKGEIGVTEVQSTPYHAFFFS